MRFTPYALQLSAAASLTLALGVDFTPPEVLSYVSSALAQNSKYVHYEGPSPTWLKEHPNLARPTEAVKIPDASACDYWMGQITHQGRAAFNANPSTYQVFRNVKDYGAKGDGVTDDAAAINKAISSGGRCGPGTCASSTVTPAVVFFPPGVYMINSSIIDYYYTQIIGNPICMPTIRAFSTFSGAVGLIDGDEYGANGLSFGATNVFWRQIRNFIIDMTLIPASSAATGIHWPTAQATSLQNIVFQMSSALGTQHQGVLIEQGSGGFMTDLVFNGGLYGGNWGNQQFTMRNMTFNNVVVGINMIWDWGWTFKGMTFNNCSSAVNMTAGGTQAQAVGSLLLLDSTINNTPIGVNTSYTPTAQPPTAGSLILENIAINNVSTIVRGANGPVLTGSKVVTAWGEGHAYTPTGPTQFRGSIMPAGNPRPASLITSNGQYYQRSKPQYETVPAANFVSARAQGAKGDGVTDDTTALQEGIVLAASEGKVFFVDHGDYIVTGTITIPAGSKIVGESYSVILSSGKFFNDINNPKPVVSIGAPGDKGSIEWSDMIVSTQGEQQGAILIAYNLVSDASAPSGMWDVHARIGGFKGSNLELAQCPTTPNVTVTSANLVQGCIAAYLTMHITKGATGLYMENVWLWTADHDVDDPNLTQITVYAGRGFLDESTAGPVWMVGTAVEHHTKYQYQFAGAANVFAGFIQTETPYYQPNPAAPLPFPYNAGLLDPQFPTQTVTVNGTEIPAANAWGLRIVDSKDILVYGAGHYSFFNNYNVTCSNQGNGEICQNRIVDLDGTNSAITIYTLSTVGTHYQITQGTKDVALYSDNLDGFVDTIARFSL